MSYYENRIKALEARVEEMAQRERMKAIPVEAKLMDIIKEQKEQIKRLTKAGDELERVLTSRISSYEVGNASHEWRSAKGVKS